MDTGEHPEEKERRKIEPLTEDQRIELKRVREAFANASPLTGGVKESTRDVTPSRREKLEKALSLSPRIGGLALGGAFAQLVNAVVRRVSESPLTTDELGALTIIFAALGAWAVVDKR